MKTILEKSGLLTSSSTIADVVSSYPYFAWATIEAAKLKCESKPEEKQSSLQTAYAYSGNWYKLQQQLYAQQATETPVDLSDILMPMHTENYFASQKITVSESEVEEFVDQEKEKKKESQEPSLEDAENNLMITMSFNEWLSYFKKKKEQELKEEESKQALRAMWQKEKLTAAIEEENDIVPEKVFKMAIDSIQHQDSTASESLAEILLKQGKTDKAIEMYRKLSLLNTEKSAYFASKIKEIKNNL
jgi:tetratricopeptide (TPR) repeat protein